MIYLFKRFVLRQWYCDYCCQWNHRHSRRCWWCNDDRYTPSPLPTFVLEKPKPLDQIIAELPPERQAKVNARTEELIAENVHRLPRAATLK